MKQNKSAYDRVLEAYANEYIKEHIDQPTLKLIRLANYDLHFGPALASDCNEPATDEYGNENEWSGFSFEKACKLIKEALEDVPHKLYIDIMCENYSDSEPQYEDCPVCDKSGMTVNDEGDEIKCDNCNGEGIFEPDYENIYEVERLQLIKAIVGKELSNYV